MCFENLGGQKNKTNNITIYIYMELYTKKFN